ncbi:MAG: sigma-54 dependent transcriptional regulator [Nitrospiraceae bacterium]|nr:sigma-54 dependent transcriptional regulator [Nitrospiraceae bacterium]
MAFRILVAEDEEITLKHLLYVLQKEGYKADGTKNGLDALGRMEDASYDLLIADIRMPGLNGLDLLARVKRRFPETDVIIITGFASVDTAKEAIKRGAFDYITKPFDLDELIAKVRKIRGQSLLRKKNVSLKTFTGADKKISVIAKSRSMRKILETIEGIKDSDCNVLLTGESGVGKNLLAKIIHYTSPRGENPFLNINCATLSEELLASELFGHEKGAFTGAIKSKQGLVEVANSGTLFLDEIAEMSPNLQAKLLKVIEEGEFYRVGGTRPVNVDVRFVASTNQNVRRFISEGRFREDLYYRLNVMEVFIPPLRDRKDDIEPLGRYFLEKHLPRARKEISGFSKEAMKVLLDYSFPGNVRELENIIERAVILEKGPLITPESLPPEIMMYQIETVEPGRIKTMEELNREYAMKVVELLGGNRSKAAELLGISRTSLWRILREE